VIDLMFLQNNSLEIDNYLILPDLKSTLDYAPLTVNIIINKKFIQDKQCTIIKNSKEEENFIKELRVTISNIFNISNIDSLDNKDLNID